MEDRVANQEWTTLAKAPIQEALLDIRVELPPDIDARHLESFGPPIATTYPNRTERKEQTLKVSLTAGAPGGELEASANVLGHLWANDERTRIVQTRVDGFTLNWLKPYTNWEDLRGEGQRLWRMYAEIAQPVRVTRLALRYINRIEIPVEAGALTDYFRSLPIVADGIGDVATFLMRCVVPDPGNGNVLFLTESMQPVAPEAASIPITLDLDAVHDRSYAPGDPTIWSKLESLRDLKNRAFFQSLTHRALEVYR